MHASYFRHRENMKQAMINTCYSRIRPDPPLLKYIQYTDTKNHTISYLHAVVSDSELNYSLIWCPLLPTCSGGGEVNDSELNDILIWYPMPLQQPKFCLSTLLIMVLAQNPGYTKGNL